MATTSHDTYRVIDCGDQNHDVFFETVRIRGCPVWNYSEALYGHVWVNRTNHNNLGVIGILCKRSNWTYSFCFSIYHSFDF